MAARLSVADGSSRSKPKAAAARANGSLGGRPGKLAMKDLFSQNGKSPK